MSKSKYYSPLRYPGGKASLYDFLVKTLKENHIVDGEYAEGFAGGAGAALKLLMLEDVYKIHLNDSDQLVYSFWYSVLNHTEELCRKIADTDINLQEWSFRKEIMKDKMLQKKLDIVELGFTSFFLNRCNRSGILKAGVIGGLEQSGKWKIDARYNKEDLISRIQQIAYYKERISLYNQDILDFLKSINKMKTDSKIFTYLDPPYVVQGKELYRHYFKEEKHKELADYLQRRYNHLWLVSYDDHPLIHKSYREVSKNIFEFNYYANRTKVGRELVISSKKCALPNYYIHYSRPKVIDNKLYMAV